MKIRVNKKGNNKAIYPVYLQKDECLIKHAFGRV